MDLDRSHRYEESTMPLSYGDLLERLEELDKREAEDNLDDQERLEQDLYFLLQELVETLGIPFERLRTLRPEDIEQMGPISVEDQLKKPLEKAAGILESLPDGLRQVIRDSLVAILQRKKN